MVGACSRTQTEQGLHPSCRCAVGAETPFLIYAAHPLMQPPILTDVIKIFFCNMTQVRLYPQGVHPVLVKGTLTPCPRLPPRTIVVTSSMVKAPSINVLRTWQKLHHEPTLPNQTFFTLLPHLAASSSQEGSSGGSDASPSEVGGSGGDHVDLAIVNNNYHWSNARLNMDLVFLLDRGRCSQLRAYLKE